MVDKRYITVEEMRKHLNIDFEDDDAYLVSITDAAQAAVTTYLQRPLGELEDEFEQLRPDVRHAIKLLAASFYANREAVSFGSPQELPFGIAYLLTPYKKYTTE